MTDIVIRVENLSKRYVLKHASGQRSGDGLRHAIQDAVTSPFRRLNAKFRKQSSDTADSDIRSPISGSQEDFYALRDVSFEVRRGEVLGIIGRNGAGKSTLLKILSRITEPTKGRIGIKGRVASLLEVGTGFHAELTGRENIYLNGAILGMSRAEVRSKFDEISEFAEIERFLDTPVKKYSSGMYVRLAFSVAAHLEPEILIVDEVLAVGDLGFQKKCLGKLEKIGKHGRTVVFVSHDMRMIRHLCNRGIYLSGGKTATSGNIDDCIATYSAQDVEPNITFPRTSKYLTVREFAIKQGGLRAAIIDGGRPFTVRIAFALSCNVSSFRIGVYIRTPLGEVVARAFLPDWDPKLESLAADDYEAALDIPRSLLSPGLYDVALHASRFAVEDLLGADQISCRIAISAPADFNQAHPGEVFQSLIMLPNPWSLQRL